MQKALQSKRCHDQIGEDKWFGHYEKERWRNSFLWHFMWVCSILLEQNISTCKLFFCLYFFYYIHTEIYTLKSRRVNFRSQTDVNQSNVAYRFSHMWEKSSNQEPRIMFFHVWAVRQVEVFIQGWLERFRTPSSLCESEERNSFYSHFFHC